MHNSEPANWVVTLCWVMHCDGCNIFKVSEVDGGVGREEGDEFSLLLVGAEPVAVQPTEDFFKT